MYTPARGVKTRIVRRRSVEPLRRPARFVSGSRRGALVGTRPDALSGARPGAL